MIHVTENYNPKVFWPSSYRAQNCEFMPGGSWSAYMVEAGC